MATAPYSTTAPGAFRTFIVYDPETHDFAMFLNGDLIGFARTYQEAEVTLAALVCALLALQGGHVAPSPPDLPPAASAHPDQDSADPGHAPPAAVQPPIDLADFACLMRGSKLHAARRLAQLAAQPGGDHLLYRQAVAWAGYLTDRHLFPGHDVWQPDDVLANFRCAIRVYLASRRADETDAA
jgi:hypothetical protein